MPAFFLWPRIPADLQRLIAPPGEGNQILLKRIITERVIDSVIGRDPIFIFGVDPELVSFPIKTALVAEMLKGVDPAALIRFLTEQTQATAPKQVVYSQTKVPIMSRAPVRLLPTVEIQDGERVLKINAADSDSETMKKAKPKAEKKPVAQSKQEFRPPQ